MKNHQFPPSKINPAIVEATRGIEDIVIGKVAGLNEAEFRKALRGKNFKQKETKRTKN